MPLSQARRPISPSDDFSGTLADSYDSAKWAVAESQGVVFFPAAGSRFDTEIWKTGSYGNYWSAVVKDIPSDSMAVGNPCKVIKVLNKEH